MNECFTNVVSSIPSVDHFSPQLTLGKPAPGATANDRRDLVWRRHEQRRALIGLNDDFQRWSKARAMVTNGKSSRVIGSQPDDVIVGGQ